ncbi:hypothetical protein FGO68_gene8207 [Halteria grandinella]|uniref:Uncharacterized protein n=1 Tax=Halteria grandinella TaxID=5974 RepID=A0A8J8NEF0_HALGN|nr:hypothetical protein FGO68_gene8207 [Halteria grandinella]
MYYFSLTSSLIAFYYLKSNRFMSSLCASICIKYRLRTSSIIAVLSTSEFTLWVKSSCSFEQRCEKLSRESLKIILSLCISSKEWSCMRWNWLMEVFRPEILSFMVSVWLLILCNSWQIFPSRTRLSLSYSPTRF